MKDIIDKILNLDKNDSFNLIDTLAKDELFVIPINDKKYVLSVFQNNIKLISNLDIINTDDLEPLSYPVENVDFYLRSDNIINEFDKDIQDEWLSTKKVDKERYVVINYEKK